MEYNGSNTDYSNAAPYSGTGGNGAAYSGQGGAQYGGSQGGAAGDEWNSGGQGGWQWDDTETPGVMPARGKQIAEHTGRIHKTGFIIAALGVLELINNFSPGGIIIFAIFGGIGFSAIFEIMPGMVISSVVLGIFAKIAWKGELTSWVFVIAAVMYGADTLATFAKRHGG